MAICKKHGDINDKTIEFTLPVADGTTEVTKFCFKCVIGFFVKNIGVVEEPVNLASAACLRDSRRKTGRRAPERGGG